MVHPWRLDCGSIGARQGVAGYSGNAGACTCSVFAVSRTTLLSSISWLELTSYEELLLSTALTDMLLSAHT